MDFTIVTPSYNYGQFIRDCIESVLQQKGVTFEHWIIDAGSTDTTHSLLKEFPHLKVLVEPDRGMSEAINKGFRRAQGTWVMWLNADDRLKHGALAEVLAFAQSQPATDVIYGSYDYVDRDGRLLRRMRLLPFNAFINNHYGCYVPSTAAFYRNATTIQRGFLLEEQFRLAMDKEFYARLAQAGMRFSYFPCVLADFRIHDRNLSGFNAPRDRSMKSLLDRAARGTESVAVRRAYGITLSESRMVQDFVDAILHFVAWGLKGLLKLSWWFKLREPKAAKGHESASEMRH